MQQGSAALVIRTLVLAAAAVLAGCGGGGSADVQPPPPAIKKVIVVGSGYSDVGAWDGFRSGVQNFANPADVPLYSDLIAAKFGVPGQCSFFDIHSAFHVVTVNERPGCTNFAQLSAAITPVVRVSIPEQLEKAALAQGGPYTAKDLVLMEGGGEDFNAILQAGLNSDSSLRSRVALLVDQQTLDTLFAQPRGYELVASLAMERLADRFYDLVQSQLLDKGATHVVLLDMPDYARTPLLQLAMSSTSIRPDAGTLEGLQATTRGWVDRFNARLRQRVGNDPRILLVPFHDDFVEVVTHPADHGLTNVTGQVCMMQGTGSCDATTLDAAAPPGLSAGWWKTWLFTLGATLTPKGQQLLAESVDRALLRAGWR